MTDHTIGNIQHLGYNSMWFIEIRFLTNILLSPTPCHSLELGHGSVVARFDSRMIDISSHVEDFYSFVDQFRDVEHHVINIYRGTSITPYLTVQNARVYSYQVSMLAPINGTRCEVSWYYDDPSNMRRTERHHQFQPVIKPKPKPVHDWQKTGF